MEKTMCGPASVPSISRLRVGLSPSTFCRVRVYSSRTLMDPGPHREAAGQRFTFINHNLPLGAATCAPRVPDGSWRLRTPLRLPPHPLLMPPLHACLAWIHSTLTSLLWWKCSRRFCNTFQYKHLLGQIETEVAAGEFNVISWTTEESTFYLLYFWLTTFPCQCLKAWDSDQTTTLCSGKQIIIRDRRGRKWEKGWVLGVREVSPNSVI